MLKKYQSLVNEAIPITDYMQWSIEQLTTQQISTITRLEPNINIHGTVYAGSIYAAAMATGWTVLKYWCDNHHYETQLVAAEASIKYLSPVAANFSCHSNIDITAPQYIKLVDRLHIQQSCGYLLDVEVHCNSKVCAILNIQYVFQC